MRTSLLDARTIAVALASVAAAFAFLVPFAFISDRIGGWPAGYVASGAVAIVVFVVVLPLARRYLSRPAESKPHENPRPPEQTTIVQTPVHVNVPVNVQVGREPEVTLKVVHAPAKETPAAARESPRPQLEPKTDLNAILSRGVRNVCEQGPHHIEPGRPKKISLEVNMGDTILGTLEEKDGEEFEWMVMDEDNWVQYLNTSRCELQDRGHGRRENAYRVRWRVPRRGPWFLILEAYGKKNDRTVWANLRLE